MDFGSHDLLAVGRGPDGATYRTYIMFDLSELADAEVVRAELRLVNNPRWSSGAEVLDVLVFPAARRWSESELTWLRQPGGSGGPSARISIRPEYNGVTTIDVTDLVSSWFSRSMPNRGLMLRARPEKVGSRAVWYSSEASAVDHRPRLEVEVQ